MLPSTALRPAGRPRMLKYGWTVATRAAVQAAVLTDCRRELVSKVVVLHLFPIEGGRLRR